jgi:GTP pyrophosphokinase
LTALDTARPNASPLVVNDLNTDPKPLAPPAANAPDAQLRQARTFAEPLLTQASLDTGENILAHADAMVDCVREIGGSAITQAACYLGYASVYLAKPQDALAKLFGEELAHLAIEAQQLNRVQRQARTSQSPGGSPQSQAENVRRMLLAFSRDLRVVMLRLASRLQTLRYHASVKQVPARELALESLHVFAPLANRLGIWQIKWALEDLAFRFLEPETYKEIAGKLDEKRTQREHYVEQLRLRMETELRSQGVAATVQGRPKHIYSIVKKMRGKSLDFEQIFDVRALRVVVPTERECYVALSWVHSRFTPLPSEFDDYIARPKSNGYQSLHSVVQDDAGRPIEIQIRTQAMHDHAEHGVAAHWAYKEAGAKGYGGVSASGAYDAKIAVLRQLLAWERDLAAEGLTHNASLQNDALSDRIYVLTPMASIVELPQGATAVDFAYSLHTDLGHRCRGARVDGALVPLSTPLKNGQTVEILTAKDSAGHTGPSRDWLNPELGFLVSARARAKVRAWFNALAAQETMARGREAVEKLLQREGKTSIRLEELAARLGFKTADDLFDVVGKDEFSLHNIEILLKPPEAAPDADAFLLQKKSRPSSEKLGKGGVLVVGMDSLLTQLARCCKPAPPDAISGYVTRGQGVSIHRQDCSNFRHLAQRQPDRLIEVEWGKSSGAQAALYAVNVAIEALDRQGLLRDISEVFAKEKMNVTGVQTQSVKGTAWMTFTVEITDAAKLHRVLGLVAEVPGVRSARRP